MVEGLLLDRIDAESGRAPIGGKHNPILLAGAHEAQTALSFMELTLAGADITLDAAVLQSMPVAARPVCFADDC
jgi:hypothetical protein